MDDKRETGLHALAKAAAEQSVRYEKLTIQSEKLGKQVERLQRTIDRFMPREEVERSLMDTAESLRRQVEANTRWIISTRRRMLIRWGAAVLLATLAANVVEHIVFGGW